MNRVNRSCRTGDQRQSRQRCREDELLLMYILNRWKSSRCFTYQELQIESYLTNYDTDVCVNNCDAVTFLYMLTPLVQ